MNGLVPLIALDMKPEASTNHPKALWIGDLHLDKASPKQLDAFFNHVSHTDSSIVIVTGDISSSTYLRKHLLKLAEVCAPRPVYFVLGNHDYYGSSIEKVESNIAELSGSVENLFHLDGKCIIPLSEEACLIGHRGWADARAGYGTRTVIDSPDWKAINEFRGLTKKQSMNKMVTLGKESAMVFRKTLPLALARFRHVVIATHTPPFPSAVKYAGKPCGPTHLPHFTNLSAGMAILGITRAFPKRQITVLSGHTHSNLATWIRPNLAVYVGRPRSASPKHLEIIGF